MATIKSTGSSNTPRICSICNKALKNGPHGHGVGLPYQDMGPVSTPRPMVGTPPAKKRK